MATPVKKRFNCTKERILTKIDKVIDESGFTKVGIRDDLGFISMDIGKEDLLYIQIIEEKGAVRLALATGLSYMKDRDQNEQPLHLIETFIHELETKLKA